MQARDISAVDSELRQLCSAQGDGGCLQDTVWSHRLETKSPKLTCPGQLYTAVCTQLSQVETPAVAATSWLTNLGSVEHDFAVCGRGPFRADQQVVRHLKEAVGQGCKQDEHDACCPGYRPSRCKASSCCLFRRHALHCQTNADNCYLQQTTACS